MGELHPLPFHCNFTTRCQDAIFDSFTHVNRTISKQRIEGINYINQLYPITFQPARCILECALRLVNFEKQLTINGCQL